MVPGPLADLKDELYGLYLSAYPITLAQIHARIHALADGDEASDPTSTPTVETIHTVLSDPTLPANVRHVVAVAAALLHPQAVPGSSQAVRGHPEIERIRRLWERAALDRPAGVPVADVGAEDLEVHRALPLDDADAVALPSYVVRPHDEVLHDLVRAAMAKSGRSGMAMLISGSTSGKTRACFEALRWVGGQPAARSLATAGWRVWPQINPMLPQRFLDELDRVGHRTVIWLNEAQRYLLEPASDTATAIAARLRALLADRSRAPVLLLGTLWPNYRDTIMRRPPDGQPDPHAHARALLTGHTIVVPDTFTGQDLAAARASTDPRIRDAAGHAEHGAITQHLAGVPDLMDRYIHATAPARAVLHAAMDARRFGHGEWLPREFLRSAAPAYLDQREHREYLLDPDWFNRALDELTAPHTAKTRALYPYPAVVEHAQNTRLRLEDYLDHHGHRTRNHVVPTQGFWDAAADYADTPADLHQLGVSALARHRLRIAATLLARAGDAGVLDALTMLAQIREQIGDDEGAEQLLRRAADAGHGGALVDLALLRESVGDQKGCENLLRRAADAGVTKAMSLIAGILEKAGNHQAAEQFAFLAAANGDPDGLYQLTEIREKAGEINDAEPFLRRAAEGGAQNARFRLMMMHEKAGERDCAEQLALRAENDGDHDLWESLVYMRGEAGDHDAVEQFLHRAVDGGYFYALLELAWIREGAGDYQGAEQFLRRAGRGYALVELAAMWERAGDSERADRFASGAAADGYPSALSRLAEMREEAGKHDDAEQLAIRAANVGDPSGLSRLAKIRKDAGDPEGAERLFLRAADAGDRTADGCLLVMCEEAGDHAGAQRVFHNAADHGRNMSSELWSRRAQQPWEQIYRRGLEPDGSISEPW